ncbi:exodeoxyribonuclease VII small subunit [Pseudoclavibacter sp. 13-3]|uniref:exodeoxyribonuclease VII small subunit n=1 Tax=Pseudoclavibacter sp. 13-3 TaxID=2901228 RepID=UPI001E335F20|nr:exodeoxyribonuclease VII small subunit [Pseudoclavibacter sp. 13-3]MCD7102212.1 exodeoxyribonuclease VII small subunit [Pseudoclavibacter sp. 13-3]
MAHDYAQEVADLSYETARDQLAETVNRLEQGGATLEESLELWERGTALADRCEQWLTGARQRLEAAQETSAAGRQSAVAGDEDTGAAGAGAAGAAATSTGDDDVF